MTENKQTPKLKWKDKEYEQSSLTDQQKYLFSQLIDVLSSDGTLGSVIENLAADTKQKLQGASVSD